MKKPAYFLFEILPDDIKAQFKIKSQSRYDLTRVFNPGSYCGLDAFKKPNGQTVLYIIPAREIASADNKRQAEWALTDGKLNLSSLYFEDSENMGFAYGYPNPKQRLSNGQFNPLFQYRGDGYLFLSNPQLTRIEILIFPDCRNLITAQYYALLDGSLDELINDIREQSHPSSFDYGLNSLKLI